MQLPRGLFSHRLCTYLDADFLRKYLPDREAINSGINALVFERLLFYIHHLTSISLLHLLLRKFVSCLSRHQKYRERIVYAWHQAFTRASKVHKDDSSWNRDCINDVTADVVTVCVFNLFRIPRI
jgi:hypothetical protein